MCVPQTIRKELTELRRVGLSLSVPYQQSSDKCRGRKITPKQAPIPQPLQQDQGSHTFTHVHDPKHAVIEIIHAERAREKYLFIYIYIYTHTHSPSAYLLIMD